MLRTRKLLARLVVASLVVVPSVVHATPSGAIAEPPDAPAGAATTYQLDALHDGWSTDQLATPLGKLWSRDLGQQVGYPLMVNGRVFVTTSQPFVAYGTELWALDASNGSILWGPLSLGGTYAFAGIAADGQYLYAVTFNGFLRQIDQATGAFGWSENLPNQSAFTSPPTVRNGTVYVGGAGSGGTLYAVDAATGAVNWTGSVENGDDSSPAVTDDGVYVSYVCEVSYKFDPVAGTNLWTHTTGCEGGGGRTAVVHGNRLYVRDDAGMGPAILSTDTGAQVGAFTSTRAPAFSADRMFTLSSGNLQAVDVATNQIEWTQAGDGQLVTAPLVIGNAVAVGSSTGEVFLFDATTGATLWSANAGSPIATPDEHNAVTLTGLAESGGLLLVPASNVLVAYATDNVSVAPSTSSFGNQRVGTYGDAQTYTITNHGTADESLSDIALAGTNPNDFFGVTNCFPSGKPRVLAAGVSCRVAMNFGPLAAGVRNATLTVTSSSAGAPDTVQLSGTGTEGYFLAGAHGEVGNFGDAVFHGDASHLRLAAPITSIAPTPNGAGYWLLGRDGGIFSFGNANFYGSTGAIRLNKPVVAMTPTADGKGYWLVAGDGGIFAFGDAHFYGSAAGAQLARPVVSIAATPSGHGYWLVTDGGGVRGYGDAHLYASTTAPHITARVTQIIATPTGHGYWLQAADGHVFAFGDARAISGRPPSAGAWWAWRQPPTEGATGRPRTPAPSSPTAMRVPTAVSTAAG